MGRKSSQHQVESCVSRVVLGRRDEEILKVTGIALLEQASDIGFQALEIALASDEHRGARESRRPGRTRGLAEQQEGESQRSGQLDGADQRAHDQQLAMVHAGERNTVSVLPETMRSAHSTPCITEWS